MTSDHWDIQSTFDLDKFQNDIVFKVRTDMVMVETMATTGKSLTEKQWRTHSDDLKDLSDHMATAMTSIQDQLETEQDRWEHRENNHTEDIYYDLIRLHPVDEDMPQCHIPAPILFRHIGLDTFTNVVRRAAQNHVDHRHDGYYRCPVCHRNSFYQGLCNRCKRIVRGHQDVIPVNEDQYDDFDMDSWEETQSQKQDIKDTFIQKLHERTVTGAMRAAGIDKLGYVRADRSKHDTRPTRVR